MQLAQPRQQRREVAVADVLHRGDAGPRQRVVIGAFAELAAVDRGREADVGHHALVLRAAAAGQEELRDGHLDLAVARALVGRPAVEVEQVLHRALAEGRLADDQAAAVVLDGTGHDLRSRGRGAIHQHRQRPVPGDAGLAVGLHVDAAARLAHLHHRAGVDEQAGQFDRLVERAAAVVAQVQHHAVEVLAAELAEDARHVAGGRGVVAVAAAATLEVLVERRQLDHADAPGVAGGAGRDVEHLGLRGLFLQPHLGARERDPHRLAVEQRFHRHHVQPHLAARLALDPVDHVVDAPADHVLHRPAAALADADDAVARRELAAARGRAAGDQLADHHHVVLLLQLRADAFQRQRHALGEQVRGARVEVVGVRIDRGRVGIEEGLERVFLVELGDAGGHVGVALVERGADLGGLLAGQLQAQPVVAHGLLPERVELGLVLGPRRVLAVVVPALVGVEVEDVLAQQVARVLHALGHALLVDRVHLHRRRGIALAHGLAQRRLVAPEARDVGGVEEQLVGVQRLEVAAEDVLRQRGVQPARAVGVAAVREQAVDQLRGGGVVGRGTGRDRIAARPRHQRQGHGQRQGDDGGGQGLACFHGQCSELTWGGVASCANMASR